MSDLKNLLINVGYDNTSYLNLHNYDIEPDWIISGKTSISNLLDNTLGNFKESSIHFFIKNNLNFIYPIILFDNKLTCSSIN